MDFDKTRIKSTCLWTQTIRKGINAHIFIHCLYNAKTANLVSHLPQETKALQMTALIAVTDLCLYLLNMVSGLCTHPAQLPQGCDYVTHLPMAALKVWDGLGFLQVQESVVSIFFLQKKCGGKHNRPRGVQAIHPFTLK